MPWSLRVSILPSRRGFSAPGGCTPTEEGNSRIEEGVYDVLDKTRQNSNKAGGAESWRGGRMGEDGDTSGQGRVTAQINSQRRRLG